MHISNLWGKANPQLDEIKYIHILSLWVKINFFEEKKRGNRPIRQVI